MPRLTIGPSGELVWSDVDQPIMRSLLNRPEPEDDEDELYEDEKDEEREDDTDEEEPDADDAEVPEFTTHDLGGGAFLQVKGDCHPGLIERCKAIMAERV
jgi:hypothetical protein